MSNFLTAGGKAGSSNSLMRPPLVRIHRLEVKQRTSRDKTNSIIIYDLLNTLKCLQRFCRLAFNYLNYPTGSVRKQDVNSCNLVCISSYTLSLECLLLLILQYFRKLLDHHQLRESTSGNILFQDFRFFLKLQNRQEQAKLHL